MAAKATSSSAKQIFAVIGSDEGMVREKAHHLYQKLTGGVDDGFTHETIDGVADNVEAAFGICATVVQSLLTLPMFGGDKVVWLRNANFLADNQMGRYERAQAGVENLRATLEQGLPNGVTFLLTAQGIDKRRAFWKFFEKAATVETCDKIDTNRDGWQDQVKALVMGRARALGLSFEPDALEVFVQLAGEQSQQIGSELEKLDLYLGPERRLISEADVDQLVPFSRDAAVTEIGKAIQAGHAGRAIQWIDQQLEADESAIGIMRASIISVVRNLYLAKLLTTHFKLPGGNYPAFSDAVKRLPEADRSWLPQNKDGTAPNTYPIFLALKHAGHFELDDLQRLMEATLKADQSLVTTGLDHRLILHRLVVQINAARDARKRS